MSTDQGSASQAGTGDGSAAAEPPDAGVRSVLRRRRRRRRLQAVAAVLATALLLATVATVYLVRSPPEPQVEIGDQRRSQTTLLVQVVGRGGDALSSTVFGVDADTGEGAALLVPPQVLVDVPGAGSTSFGRALRSGTPDSTRAALADLLGLTLDGGWGMTAQVFTGLVDTLGGIEAEVDREVVVGRDVVLTPGRQRLDGDSALRLLEHRAPDEEEAARLARQQQVLSGLLEALPDDDELLGVLQGLGERSVTNLPLTDLAAVLGRLRDATRDGQLQYDLVPVEGIDTGAGSVTTARAEPAAVRALVDRLFPQSVLPGTRDTGNRVLVLDGVGTPGLAERVRERLVPAGLVFVGARTAPDLGQQQTRVLLPEASPQARELGERVAAALGVPSSSVATAELGAVADVVVLVGADFPG